MSVCTHFSYWEQVLFVQYAKLCQCQCRVHPVQIASLRRAIAQCASLFRYNSFFFFFPPVVRSSPISNEIEKSSNPLGKMCDLIGFLLFASGAFCFWLFNQWVSQCFDDNRLLFSDTYRFPYICKLCCWHNQRKVKCDRFATWDLFIHENVINYKCSVWDRKHNKWDA